MFNLLKYYTTNIGDDIQTIAMEEFLGQRADGYVYRDHMNLIKVPYNQDFIVNGWFMHGLDFPPPQELNPLYISFCIGEENFINEQALEHFKKYEPIGCRDKYTYNYFASRNIKAYISECITLTLHNEKQIRNNDVYFVDLPTQLEDHFKIKFPYFKRISHFCERDLSFEERRKRGLEILNIYKTSKLVITTRMHAAYPCIAYNTPVFLFPIEDKNRYSFAFRNMEIIKNNLDIPDCFTNPIKYDKEGIRNKFKLYLRDYMNLKLRE